MQKVCFYGKGMLIYFFIYTYTEGRKGPWAANQQWVGSGRIEWVFLYITRRRVNGTDRA